ncbi:MAG: two-component system response regulator [Spirochaetes bacterium RIFOXYC1_FULL_54_7]|nr:MAG: two-component system response regulator [Spirochaetes bacterium RIFOXYC1_FULL_54_7]
MSECGAILFAEDNAKDVELVLETLAESHFPNRVVHVKDGVKALEYLRCEGEYKSRESGNPAVTVLDLKMPRMDGFGVLSAIRSDPSLKYIPVVMLTSSQEERDIIRSYELGTNAYVVKPVRFSDFINAIRLIGKFWFMLNEPPGV